jgi:hypothetical protein
MNFDYSTLAALRKNHPAWKLLMADCRKQVVLLEEKNQLRDCREILTPFFAFHKRVLFKKFLM